MEQLPLWGGRSTLTPRHAIPLLSKSRFAAGLQCVKRLYLECYEGGLREKVKPATQALFEAGASRGGNVYKLPHLSSEPAHERFKSRS